MRTTKIEIYILKHMETLERMPFTAKKKIFKRLAEIADSSCLSQEEREKYDESRKVADDWYSGMYGAWFSGNKAGLEEGLAKGEARGLAKGEARGLAKGEIRTTQNIAKKMLLAGQPDALISEFTGLSLEQINHLKNNH